MKKLTAIFLLTLFAFSSNYTWIVEMINHHQMRIKVASLRETGADPSDIDTLVFTDREFQQLHFEDEGHELEYRGEMYDIISIRHLPGKKIVSCLSDKKETHLKQLAKSQRKQKELRVKNTLAKIYVPTGVWDYLPTALRPQNTYPHSAGHHPLMQRPTDILKPPPDRLS